MSKNPALQNMLDSLAKMMGAKATPSESQAAGICFVCGELAEPRCTTDAGRKEYKISSMCEICWDKLFMEEGQEGEDA